MRAQRIYLETTLFNFYFEKERDAHFYTAQLFNEIATGKYKAYASTYVTDELEEAPKEKRDTMLGLIAEYDIEILAPNDEVVRIANLYVARGVIPQKHRTDALHIAVATVYDLDMVVSMNFKHIVKRKTIITTGEINKLNGYHAVEIYSPMEVIEDETA